MTHQHPQTPALGTLYCSAMPALIPTSWTDCAICTVYCILYTAYCVLHTVYCILYTAYCAKCIHADPKASAQPVVYICSSSINLLSFLALLSDRVLQYQSCVVSQQGCNGRPQATTDTSHCWSSSLGAASCNISTESNHSSTHTMSPLYVAAHMRYHYSECSDSMI